MVADATDADALGAGLAGVRDTFPVSPPNYDPEPGFPGTRRAVAAVIWKTIPDNVHNIARHRSVAWSRKCT